MSLPDGKVMSNGVIVGAWPPFPFVPPPVRRPSALSEVALKLKQQFTLAVFLGEDRGDETTYLSNGRRTERFVAGSNGTVVRVLQGVGVVIVNSTTYALDQGDWAYIPHGRPYFFEGRVIAGLNFQVAYADLLRG